MHTIKIAELSSGLSIFAESRLRVAGNVRFLAANFASLFKMSYTKHDHD